MGLITLKFLPLRWGLWKCGSRRRVVGRDDTYLPSSGVRPAAAPAAPTWQVPKAQRRRGGGAAGPSLSALRPSACGATVRSSTARGRARLPGGGAHWSRRGSEGGGPAASWLPLGHSRGWGEAVGTREEAEERAGGGGSCRPLARLTAGRPKSGHARRRGGRKAGETHGEADGAAAEGGEDGGRLGAAGHPPSPLSSAHPATAGPGCARAYSGRRGASRRGQGAAGPGHQSVVGRGSGPPPPLGHPQYGGQFAEGGAATAPGAPACDWHLGRASGSGAPARVGNGGRVLKRGGDGVVGCIWTLRRAVLAHL